MNTEMCRGGRDAKRLYIYIVPIFGVTVSSFLWSWIDTIKLTGEFERF